jgi:hypothetical protein
VSHVEAGEIPASESRPRPTSLVLLLDEEANGQLAVRILAEAGRGNCHGAFVGRYTAVCSLRLIGQRPDEQ